MTEEQFRKMIVAQILSGELEYEIDNYNQILFYTEHYEHSDGTIHEDEEEEEDVVEEEEDE